MYIKKPKEIENKSFEIIRANMGEHDFDEKELKVVMRTIHTTGDYDYKNIVRFRNDGLEAGIKAIKTGCKIVTDTRMAFSGINKAGLLRHNCSIECYIDSEEVNERAKENGNTRAMAAVEMAIENKAEVFVFGNAPTALFRLGEMIKEGNAAPKFVVGVPVGFVGAAESKDFIREIDVPSISTEGNKGGSNVAAAIINALLYMADE